MTDKTPWCCPGHVSECPLCPEYGTRLIDPCPGHQADDESQEAVRVAELHARRAHPDYEYATTHGPRKQWDDSDRPPAGESCDPDYTWSPNVDAGMPGMGWERFEYHEEAYWRRPKTRSGPRETDGNTSATSAALIHNDWPAGARWLHVTFTSPDATTANTSALAIRDHLTAEFDGVSMRITTNAVETGPLTTAEEARLAQSGINTPGCDCGHDGMGVSWHGDECPWRRSVLDGGASNPAATEATSLRTRVTALYEQWVKAGPPPLGVPMARWWDRRLVELHAAIRGGAEQPARTTPDNPPTSSEWTPPPPGDRREQLPVAVLALLPDKPYLSTACDTAQQLAEVPLRVGGPSRRRSGVNIAWLAGPMHGRCRLNHKFTGALCICPCHPEEQQP